MLQQILFVIAMAAGGGDDGASAVSDGPVAPDTSTAALVAEDQTPSGRFLTAGEVKPILSMTRANWIAVREYDGQDLLYFTHLLAWRCGLLQIEYAVNDAELQIWPMPPCYVDEPTPAAIKTEDGLPYLSFPLQSVTEVRLRLTYDDLSVEEGTFGRNGMEIK